MGTKCMEVPLLPGKTRHGGSKEAFEGNQERGKEGRVTTRKVGREGSQEGSREVRAGEKWLSDWLTVTHPRKQ